MKSRSRTELRSDSPEVLGAKIIIEHFDQPSDQPTRLTEARFSFRRKTESRVSRAVNYARNVRRASVIMKFRRQLNRRSTGWGGAVMRGEEANRRGTEIDGEPIPLIVATRLFLLPSPAPLGNYPLRLPPRAGCGKNFLGVSLMVSEHFAPSPLAPRPPPSHPRISFSGISIIFAHVFPG